MTTAACEDEMATDYEQLPIERGDIHAVARCRHRWKSIPVVDRRIEHFDIAQHTLDVIVAMLAARNVDFALIRRPALATAGRWHAVHGAPGVGGRVVLLDDV